MFKNKTIAVVCPAYNEETQIGKVIETMPDFVDKIIVVDDRSVDGTAQVVKKYLELDSRIVLISHEVNQGVGGAIASGYEWARDNNFDIAVVMAGDGQMDPEDLPAILEPVVNNKADYSKADRLHSRDAIRKMPRIRYIGNIILSFLTRIASGYWHITDSQSGYTAINKKALHTINWNKMYRRYGQPNDLLVRLNVYGFRVRDVPIKPIYHVGEKSKIQIEKLVFSLGFLLLRMAFWRLKEKYLRGLWQNASEHVRRITGESLTTTINKKI